MERAMEVDGVLGSKMQCNGNDSYLLTLVIVVMKKILTFKNVTIGEEKENWWDFTFTIIIIINYR